MLSSTKTFSQSLKKFTSKANPEHRQVSLYFAKNNSSPRQSSTLLPSLSASQSILNRQARSQKVKTQPGEEQQCLKQRLPSLSQRVDGIVFGLIQGGAAAVHQGDGRQRKRFKNLRIVSEQNEQRAGHKRSQAYEQVELLVLNKQISRQLLLRRKFLLDNPQIKKKVTTRWDRHPTKGPTKQSLSYYPLADLRQENQQLLMNMPIKSEDYMRKLRQTALHKMKL